MVPIAKGLVSAWMVATVTSWLAPVTALQASLGLTAVKVSHSTYYEMDMLKQNFKNHTQEIDIVAVILVNNLL